VVVAAVAAALDDWPQWRGPRRDGISTEGGLLESWPEEGPPIRWRRPVGQGFSGVSVRDGRLYTLDSQGVSHDGILEEEASELAIALRASDGRELWRTRLDDAFADWRGSGSRSSPTVTAERIFVLTARGSLVALDLDGKVLWRRDLLAEHGGELPLWGFAASPLVVASGDRSLVVVGAGGEQAGVVAYDARSGDLVWKADSGPVGYSSPIVAELGGTRQIVLVQGDRIVGVSLDGRLLWSQPWPVVNNINVATAVDLGDDRLFVSTSYDVGSVVLEVRRDEGDDAGAGFEAREVWRNRAMKNHFHTSILWRGHLYGFDNATLECIDAATGEETWAHRGLGKGSLILAGGKLIVLGERGRLVLAEADPERFEEISSVQLVRGRSWTAPTLADGFLYVRTESEILSLDLRREGGA
jgi:outer membrane protein assembly factor BamB